jgi:hypothetical protein
LSWFREGEDEDGTRHYTVEDRWGGRRKVSLTPAQRRAMNRRMGAYVCGVFAVAVIGWAIGHGRGHGLLGIVIGLGASGLAVILVLRLTSTVTGITGYFRQPKE